MKLGHTSSHSCLFPEIAAAQGPSPVKCFQRSLVLPEVKRTCRWATRLCSFSVLGFEQGLLRAATQLW